MRDPRFRFGPWVALGVLLLAGPVRADEVDPPRVGEAAATPEGLSPAEAGAVSAESEEMAAERAAEAAAGLVAPPDERLARVLNLARQLGPGAPLAGELLHLSGARPGTAWVCADCPYVRRVLELATGLDAIDLTRLDERFDIPVVVNDEVREIIHYFTEGPGRPHFQRWLDRSALMIPLMIPLLEEAGLPRDLVYVSMIESGFSTHAYSVAKAVGPWQFMKPTAKDMRLRMDSWVDERRDPISATRAAARYLGWLFEEFDDWYLAWAGYNGGPGRVGRTIAATGTNDYWALCRDGRLPTETCRYVPKILAAALVARHAREFGFTPPEKDVPFDFEEIALPHAVDLRDVARVGHIELETLQSLNPALRRQITPPPGPGGPWPLRVPAGHAEALLAAAAELKPAASGGFEKVVIRPGDTLWGLARRYGATVDDLVATNGITDARKLRPGMELMVPVKIPGGTPAPPKKTARAVVAAPKRPAKTESKPPAREPAPQQTEGTSRYTVRAGDTLWSIGMAWGLTTKDLCALNGLACGDHVALSIGQVLKVKGKPPKTHVLKAGETLWSLSQRYGVSVGDLERWNHIENASALAIGQVLRVAE